MNKNMKWMKQQVRLGWILLVVGAVLAAAGIYLRASFPALPFNARIITGLGILAGGIGISYLIRYLSGVRDPQSVTRLLIEERDERNRLIRATAGNRAYLVSAIMVIAGLMWDSFAESGSLPALTGDFLWSFLAAAAVIPGCVYLISMVYDQNHQ